MSRVLLVEDNDLNRRLAREVLSFAGHEVIEARSVEEARACLRDHARFDLALLDIQIPGGGGEAVLRSIRADATHAGTPVVAVTAQAMRGDRERLLALGFDGYVSKPIDTRTFAATVMAVTRPAGRG